MLWRRSRTLPTPSALRRPAARAGDLATRPRCSPILGSTRQRRWGRFFAVVDRPLFCNADGDEERTAWLPSGRRPSRNPGVLALDPARRKAVREAYQGRRVVLTNLDAVCALWPETLIGLKLALRILLALTLAVVGTPRDRRIITKSVRSLAGSALPRLVLHDGRHTLAVLSKAARNLVAHPPTDWASQAFRRRSKAYRKASCAFRRASADRSGSNR